MDRKALINQYKQRKVVGGIFRVLNQRNGKYLLDYAQDMQAKQNAFEFFSTGSIFYYRLREDRDKFGPEAFVFEVLEKLEKKADQTQESFVDDLKTLLELRAEKLDPALKY
jgi:hypothetical protein